MTPDGPAQPQPRSSAPSARGAHRPASGPPRFSVVIPLFNKKPFIRRTLETVLAQKHQSCEILVVDDGSTDGGTDEIQDLLGLRVRLIRQQNSGPGAARNRGMAEARFPWIALLDADDRWMAHHLSTLAKLIADFPAADVVVSGFKRSHWREPVAPQEQSPDEAGGYLLNYFREAAMREAVWTSCVAIRREAFVRSLGFRHFWPGEDSEFWARLALDHVFAATRTITAYYTTDTGGLIESGETSGLSDPEAIEQGLLGTVAKALSDPKYRPLHPDIRFFRDKLLTRLAKQELYLGRSRRARTWLAQVENQHGLELSFLRLSAAFPDRVALTAMKAYRGLKRAIRPWREKQRLT